MRAVQEPAIYDEASAHARRDHDAEQVLLATAGAEPPLAERHGLGVVVDHARVAEGARQALAQREAAPCGDEQRRDDTFWEAHRPAASDADAVDRDGRVRKDVAAEPLESREERLGVALARRAGRCLGLRQHLAVGRDDSRGELRTAGVLVQIACLSCGESSVAVIDRTGEPAGPPLTFDDVLDAHDLLAAWTRPASELFPVA